MSTRRRQEVHYFDWHIFHTERGKWMVQSLITNKLKHRYLQWEDEPSHPLVVVRTNESEIPTFILWNDLPEINSTSNILTPDPFLGTNSFAPALCLPTGAKRNFWICDPIPSKTILIEKFCSVIHSDRAAGHPRCGISWLIRARWARWAVIRGVSVP